MLIVLHCIAENFVNCCYQAITRFERQSGILSEMAIIRQPSPSTNHGLMMNAMKQHHMSTLRPYGRLKLLGGGLAFAILGSALLLRGVQVVTHWTGQPMFSWGLVAAGGLCIVLAAIPASWIAKAASKDAKTARHR